MNLDVYLDGVKQENVVTADEEAGLVLVWAANDDGGFHHRDGRLLRVAHYGAVVIHRV